MNVVIEIANVQHVRFAQQICDMMYDSALKRGTGIARRTSDFIITQMLAGKAVIAVDVAISELVGFSYVETWGHGNFISNSGLIVNPKYRNKGIAKKIKHQIFKLCGDRYPTAKIFSITTGLAVMKMNAELGFKPVPFSELTDDPQFWQSCKGCRNYSILEENNFKLCLCTGLLYEPDLTQLNLPKAQSVIENVI